MTTKNFNHPSTMLRITTALMIALSLSTLHLGLSPAVSAQTPSKTKTTASAEQGGQKEGFKVHGHWTIDVRNPDGTLVTHREFENALFISGARMLAQFLGRAAVPGQWWIVLNDGFNSTACGTLGAGIPAACVITEATDTTPVLTWWGAYARNLTVAVATDSDPTSASAAYAHNNITLSGTVFAAGNGQIGTVETRIGACAQVCPPDNNTLFGIFTGTGGSSLSTPPITVVAKQIIQVTVVISFS